LESVYSFSIASLVAFIPEFTFSSLLGFFGLLSMCPIGVLVDTALNPSS
jgi:hypothetical protein